MIIRAATYSITFTKENGRFVARSENCIGRGKSPKDALQDWRRAVETAKEMFGDWFIETKRTAQ
jgi:hypothetical protein